MMPWRLPPMAAAGILLVIGVLGGLGRMGMAWPSWWSTQPIAVHGPLMIVGFLGTLIGVERAVAHGAAWSWAMPLSAAAAGAAALVAPAFFPPLAFAAGLLLVAVYISFAFRQFSVHLAVEGAGALMLALGGLLLVLGRPVFDGVVQAWAGFLVLTLVGERIDLARMRAHGTQALMQVAALAVLAVGATTVAAWAPGTADRVLGLSWLGMGLWLLRYDVARITVRQTGLVRFMGACLLLGAAWLAAAGALLAWHGPQQVGLVYDAIWHAVFAGFTFAMIFAHAPVVLPAVLGIRLPYRPRFWVHMVGFQLATIVRLAADFAGLAGLRTTAGIVSALMLALFVASSAAAAIGARRVAKAGAIG